MVVAVVAVVGVMGMTVCIEYDFSYDVSYDW